MTATTPTVHPFIHPTLHFLCCDFALCHFTSTSRISTVHLNLQFILKTSIIPTFTSSSRSFDCSSQPSQPSLHPQDLRTVHFKNRNLRFILKSCFTVQLNLDLTLETSRPFTSATPIFIWSLRPFKPFNSTFLLQSSSRMFYQ